MAPVAAPVSKVMVSESVFATDACGNGVRQDWHAIAG
jgi:hypothetical protein